MKRRQLPPRIDCDQCGKPTNQNGYAGAECQCDIDLSKAVVGHSIKAGTRRD